MVKKEKICVVFGVFVKYFTIFDVAVIDAEDLNAIATIIYKHIQLIPGVLETLTCLAVDTDEA